MSEIKFNNKKFISDDDGFKITQDNDDFPGWNVLLSHDGTDSLKTIGEGNDFINQMIPQILVDDGYIDLPADSAGFGKIEVGESEENLIFTWARDNTVTLVDNSTNVVAADTDAKFCVFDNTSSVRIKNRLGTAQSVLFDIHYTELPIAPTFQVFNILSGVDNLDINIGGTLYSWDDVPKFRYKGGDANATNWVPWTYGETVSFVSSGAVPTYNDGSPGLGENDDSVKVNAGSYFKKTTATESQFTTGDLVIELVWKFDDADTYLLSTFGTNGIAIYNESSNKVTLYLDDAGGSATVSSDTTLVNGCWYHALFFVDRDDSSTSPEYGSRVYINAVQGATGTDFSAISGSLSDSDFAIGATTAGGSPTNSNIAYTAAWEAEDMWDGGSGNLSDWDYIAKERFAKLCGYYPEICNGGVDDITTAERTYPAYLDKVEDGYRKLYYVGSEWLRMCHRQDSEEVDVYGYLPETEAQNVLAYSEDFSFWNKSDAGDTVLNDQVICPDGRIKAASLAADSTVGLHYYTRAITFTAANYAYSVFVKPGNKDWCNIQNATKGWGCFFDVANGTVGTAHPSCTGYIEGPFHGGFYRCCIVFLATATTESIAIIIADANNDYTISDGDGSPSLYVWGAQCELGDYMTSPIITSGSALTRPKDDLQFVAGDNIGGEDVGRGSVYADVLLPDFAHSANRLFCAISDGGVSADSIIFYAVNSTNSPQVYSRSSEGGSGVGSDANDGTDNTKHTLAGLWENDNVSVMRDGVVGGTIDTSCIMPNDLDKLGVGQAQNDTLQLNGLIQNLRIYAEPTTLG